MHDFEPSKPIRVAGVRILQRGEPRPGFALRIDLVKPDGTSDALVNAAPGTNWGNWLLYPVVPKRPAVLAKRVTVNADPSLSGMEVSARAP